jgi:serine/threonine protein kinase/tetratricopeptide (TPR) repeat protein
MAAVYGAHDGRHNRSVAVKVLDSEVAASVGTARFLHEIATVAGLSHPNIVPVYDSGEQDGVLYYVMPHVEGETLRQVIKREQRISLSEVVRITGRVAAALDFAHRRGIVHRDIKPENIILFEGEPLILDFGIAKALTAAGSETITATGIAVGTPAYLSPEQASGETKLDGRSDQYSLACVVYELVSGSAPFTGASAQGVIAKRFLEKARPLSSIVPGASHVFSNAVAKAMSLETEDRFSTVSEFAEELARGLRESDVPGIARDEKPSLAVLPFTNVSPDPENEFFADGITEEIINALTLVRALRVPSRTASFAFKGKHEELDEIARKLKVSNILEGSVRKAGNHLRVTVQLIEVSTGDSIWSGRYDRELADVFAIQDEISTSIVDALKLVLSGEEKAAIKKVPTQNVRAYEYYLRGRQLYHQRSPDAMIAATDMYRHAIELDENYALAYAGLADALAVRFGSFGAGAEALSQAEAAAKRALELDPSLAESHGAHGLVLTYQARYEEAEREFEQAIALDPVSFDAAYHYARMLATAGHHERAAQMFETAGGLRPEDYQALCLAVNYHKAAGSDEKATAVAKRAIEASRQALLINPGDARALGLGSSAFLHMGDEATAREWVQRSLQIDPNNAMVAFNVCCFESIAGQVEVALGYLERAIELGFRNTKWLLHDPDLDNIRGHPRFMELVHKTETA